jgi:DNA polymerase-3 subunit epsilon
MLTSAPSFEDVAADIEKLFRDRIVVAHNLRFDWSVLRRSFESLDVYPPATCGGVCTAKVSRQVLGGISGLSRVCGRLGVSHGDFHRALSDATATVDVLRSFCELAPQEISGRPCPVFSGAWRLHRSLPAVPRADVASMAGNADQLGGE